MTKDEMIEHLLMQVNTLNASLNSLQQSFDAQTALIAQLNQTIQELKEQLKQILKTVPSRLQVMALKSLRPKVCVNLPEKKLVDRRGIREHTWLLLQSLMRL